MTEFIMVIPRGATGGTELGHQLIHVINSNTNYKGYVLYYPFNDDYQITEEFKKYNCQIINRKRISNFKNPVIILPEVLTYLQRKFKDYRTALWWMSVDNYFGSISWKYAIGNKFLPFSFVNKESLKKCFDAHFYQSEYARMFLDSMGCMRKYPLSDFLNNEYLESSFSSNKKKDIVLYNPAKGAEISRAIIEKAPDIEFRALKGLTREEVKILMSESKVYIDFGNHPGKDRIPREAAIMGACVLVGLKGSAANSLDVPIPDEYKFKFSNGSIDVDSLIKKIRSIFKNYENCSREFESYRSSIQNEPKNFLLDVNRIVDAFK